MFVAASTECYGDHPFPEACYQISELGYDKVELWLDDSSQHLKASDIAAHPDRFVTTYRETTRMTPIAIHLEHDIPADRFDGICKLAKLLKIAQITIPAAQLGTPFNEEIDRLKARLAAANAGGIRLSLKTQTGRLTEDPQTAIELCQSVNGLGLTLDVSHYICGRFASQSHDQVYTYVYHTHLRDTSATDLQVPIGLGEVDYNRVISQLQRISYQRALSVDLLPSRMGSADRPLEMRKIRMLLESLL